MELSDRWKLRFTRAMQGLLVLILLSGVYYRAPKVIINSGISLLISVLPALIERDYRISLDPLVTLWITSAIFLHSLGSFGFYETVWWWDHLTHSLSASLVAAIGYTTIRSVDIHYEEVNLPDRFMFVFILMSVLAFGVVWELVEYGLDIISEVTGIAMPLAQYGLEDTMKDMTFNTMGALLVALLGQAHLTELSERIMEQLRGLESKRVDLSRELKH